MKYLVLFIAAVALSYLYNAYTPRTLLAFVPAIPVGITILFFINDLGKKRADGE